MGLHVFPIPIPPPTSLSTRSPEVFPQHQVRNAVLVSGYSRVIWLYIYMDLFFGKNIFKKQGFIYIYMCMNPQNPVPSSPKSESQNFPLSQYPEGVRPTKC